ncbi:FAD:protein FMN transferase [uncultured Bifidobacterium sp.]|uniref:FAD:protein FMN transferase n=1 Tax=uncultured Bifidobacterium sp. TaxID=165187 RepID=UPI00261A2B60|nr:FAD:protein FMN transferase [uncultured Bifidobacterium sp.]
MHARTLNVMNLPFTILLDGPGDARVMESAIGGIGDVLVDVDRRFSPFRSDSLVCRYRAGDRSMLTDDDFTDVHSRSLLARMETDGLFDPFFRGGYDPTGLVKGWAVERAFDLVLNPLIAQGSIAAAAINAGGDMAVAPRADGDLWHIGVVDSHDGRRFVAAFDLPSGAVATSGTSERGEHVVRRFHDVVQATVIADSLVDADVWATALLAASLRDIDRLVGEHGLTAVLVLGPERILAYSNGQRTEPVEHVRGVVAQWPAGGRESCDRHREVLR